MNKMTVTAADQVNIFKAPNDKLYPILRYEYEYYANGEAMPSLKQIIPGSESEILILDLLSGDYEQIAR